MKDPWWSRKPWIVNRLSFAGILYSLNQIKSNVADLPWVSAHAERKSNTHESATVTGFTQSPIMQLAGSSSLGGLSEVLSGFPGDWQRRISCTIYSTQGQTISLISGVSGPSVNVRWSDNVHLLWRPTRRNHKSIYVPLIACLWLAKLLQHVLLV
jgi:hypothetical protein